MYRNVLDPPRPIIHNVLGYETRTMLAFPLPMAREVIVCWKILNKQDDRLFSKDDEDLLHEVRAKSVGLSIYVCGARNGPPQ